MDIILKPGKRLPIDNYYENAQQFHKMVPYFYDKAGIFWFWDTQKSHYAQVDDVDVMRLYDALLGYDGQTVTTKIKVNTLEAMKRYGRGRIPLPAKKKWVQFKNKAYSIHSKKVHRVTAKYFFTNPIPWELGKSSDTPTMDRLFKEWVGEKHVDDLYEILAYCCYSDYPLQTLFCLYGSGRNGKSCFQRLLDKFIGEENVCTTELDLIVGPRRSRFEVFKLYKKLVCSMGETDFGILNSSSMLKKLTGADKIGFEKKNKDPFDEYSYAKIVIASNSLPTATDTSDGFYRRWHIIDFPNEFPEGKDVLADIPDWEYENLALKCMDYLPVLLKKGAFSNQGSIPERREKYVMASNPLPMFLKQCCELGDDHSVYYTQYKELYTAYVQFLSTNKRRKVRLKEFKSALEDEGYWVERTSKDDGVTESGYPKYRVSTWIEGVKLKGDWKDNLHFLHFLPKIPLRPIPVYSEWENSVKSAQNAYEPKTGGAPSHFGEGVPEKAKKTPFYLHFRWKNIAHVQCSISKCESKECNFDNYGVPYCAKHWEEQAVKKK